MIYAIVMAGGRGTRLRVNVEKPLFKLHGKPLIKYVLDNISSSKLVEDVVIAVSPHTQETIKYLKSLNGNFQILNTSGIDYLNDLSYILTLFESKSKKDTLLFINADLPFVSGETIDFILTNYLESSKDSLSAQVPVEIFKKLDLKYSYEFNAGKENNNDSPSSGERTGISPNQCCYGNIGVVGPRCRKTFSEKNSLENETIDGDSPVFEAERSVVVS